MHDKKMSLVQTCHFGENMHDVDVGLHNNWWDLKYTYLPNVATLFQPIASSSCEDKLIVVQLIGCLN